MQAILALYAVMSAVAFGAYGLDKRAAARGRRRIPEARLHFFELCGGWPGALVAQRAFRHKRRKLRFMLVFWGIALAHLAAWGVWGWHRLR